MDRPRGRRKDERLAPEAWQEAALAAIARDGLAAVRIDVLAAELGVTKGSFYWHFADRDALLDAALLRWVQTHGEPAAAKLRATRDPRERLHRLLRQAVGASLGVTVQARLLGELGDARVRAALREVREARLALLHDTYAELGFDGPQAADRALATYAVYVGLLQLAREGGVSWQEAGLSRTLEGLLTSAPPPPHS
jgi:AcrR family transcriptional regulator